MILLTLGLALWIFGHLFKRVLPSVREGMGDAGRGVAALTIIASVVVMVIGYRQAAFVPVYDPPLWTRHINNLLMIIAVVLFGLGSSKSPWRAKLRHPMLLGFLTWAVAHLLVNGDLTSVVMFGVLGAWAVATIFVINANEPDYVPYDGGTTAGTVRLMGISFVVFAVIAVLAGRGGAAWGASLALASGIGIPLYFLIAQKRVYGQGWIKTLIKAGLLGGAYLFVLLVFGFTLPVVLALLA